MKTCPKCGGQIEELRTACPFCGTVCNDQNNNQNYSNYSNEANDPYNNNYNYRQQRTVSDTGSVGYWLLGFFIPIVGIILFFVWKDEQPNNAKRSLWGALVSIIASFALSVLITICGIIAIINGGGM